MRLRDLLSALHEQAAEGKAAEAEYELRGGGDVDVRDVVHDSRRVGPGALFCCIPGSRTDGHDHAGEARNRGAVALLVERFLDLDVPQVRVRAVRVALGPLAAAFHGHPSRGTRVLGVTGTNGKTTTTLLLEKVAEANGERAGVIGTIETRIAGRSRPPVHTTPEATELQSLLAEMRDAGVATVAMEVSSHAVDQHRVDGTQFASVCFTNLSHDHLDYHGSLGAYFEAKAALFTARFSPAAVVNVDDPRGPDLARRAVAQGLEVTTFGVAAAGGSGADLEAADVELGRDHSTFGLRDRRAGTLTPVRTSLVGPFNVSNALAAAGTALAGGLPAEAVVAGLAAPLVVPGRFERVDAGQDFAVVVDYAHTPDALSRLLDAARALVTPGGNLIVVFGCGGDRDRAKRPLMGGVAAAAADRVVITSDNPRSEAPEAIVAEITAGLPPARPVAVELDRRAAIRAALRSASSGDVVVIAGKGHETGQTIGGEIRPFDDRVVAREELEALA